MNTHLIQPSSKGKTKFITVTVEGATLSREWGLLGHKVQKTSNTHSGLNIGKANELTPEQVALLEYERYIKTKIDEGYRKVDSLSGAEKKAELDTIDFNNPPKSFAPSKPVTSIENDKLAKLMEQDRAKILLKENGLCHFVFTNGDGDVRIFTRRMDDHTAKYPEIVAALPKTLIPPRSVLSVELVASCTSGTTHTEAFRLIQGISRSDTVKGAAQKDLSRTNELKRVTPVRGMVFNILYWAGESLWDKPYSGAYELITKTFSPKPSGNVLFAPTEIIVRSVEELDKYISDMKRTVEGVVVWDLTSATEVSFTGKPKRKGCYKRKAILEVDVVVTGYEEGTGDNTGKIGALLMSQPDESGKLISIGKCSGTGIKYDDRDPADWTFPCVVTVEYTERFPTGKLQFPVFIGISDKAVSEADILILED